MRVARRSRGRTRARGAVLVEFTLALVPLLMVFFCSIQVSKAYTAKLALEHSATVAARAAIVVSNKNDNNPGKNGDEDDIESAAVLALGPWVRAGAFSNVKVDVQDRSSKDDPYGIVIVTVSADYTCSIPMGKNFVCGVTGRRNMKATSSLPHQGANYKVD